MLNPREIASLYLIGLGAVFIIVWDHRSQASTILSALSSPNTATAPDSAYALGESPVITLRSTEVGTNDPMPQAGNEFGRLAFYGDGLSGGVQPTGLDASFGDIFNSLGE